MSELKLEVGKRYARRDGEVVEITSYEPTGLFPFRDAHDHGYTETGTFLRSGAAHKYDIISEFTPDTKDAIRREQSRFAAGVIAEGAIRVAASPDTSTQEELNAATVINTAESVQVGGDHYRKLAIQPMRYSMENGLDACQHTIIKYVTRFRDKGGIADLEKAKHTIDLLIQFERERAE